MWWRTSNCNLLLIYRPREDKRLSWPSWLTYSGRLTHISGHPSATGRAQDGKKTMARDWRSTAEPRRPIWYEYITLLRLRRHSEGTDIVLSDGSFWAAASVAALAAAAVAAARRVSIIGGCRSRPSTSWRDNDDPSSRHNIIVRMTCGWSTPSLASSGGLREAVQHWCITTFFAIISHPSFSTTVLWQRIMICHLKLATVLSAVWLPTSSSSQEYKEINF